MRVFEIAARSASRSCLAIASSMTSGTTVHLLGLHFGVQFFLNSDDLFDRLWPKFKASTITSSDTSLAPHSTMHDAVFHTGDCQIQPAVFHFGICRVEVITSLDQPDADCCDGMFVNGMTDSVKSSRRADDGVHRRINVGIRGQNQRDYLCLILVAFGKERPDRPIDHAAVQELRVRKVCPRV